MTDDFFKKFVKKAKEAVSDVAQVDLPDICKTPNPVGAVPIPYPNIAKSSDTAKGSKKVKMDGNPINLIGSIFGMSSGDEAGTSKKKRRKV